MSEPEQDKPILSNSDGSPTRDGWRRIGEELRKPMTHRSYQVQGRTMSYINARQVQDRLDAVVGPGNWSTHYFAHADGSVECTITIFGVPKADVGYKNNPEAKPGDKVYEWEPLKAAYSDAFKRAAVHWGIGRFLYGDDS